MVKRLRTLEGRRMASASKRLIFVLVLLTAVLWVLAGCGGAGAPRTAEE